MKRSAFAGGVARQPVANFPAAEQQLRKPPLEVMQSILCSVAGKLVVLEAMRWVQKQMEGRDQRWHGLLRKGTAQSLTGGR